MALRMLMRNNVALFSPSGSSVVFHPSATHRRPSRTVLAVASQRTEQYGAGRSEAKSVPQLAHSAVLTRTSYAWPFCAEGRHSSGGVARWLCLCSRRGPGVRPANEGAVRPVEPWRQLAGVKECGVCVRSCPYGGYAGASRVSVG